MQISSQQTDRINWLRLKSMTFTEKTAQYLKGSYAEIKNITWPTKAEIKQHTILVIGISLAVAIFLGLCDYILSIGLQQLITILK